MSDEELAERLAKIELQVLRVPKSNADRTGLYMMVWAILIQTCSTL